MSRVSEITAALGADRCNLLAILHRLQAADGENCLRAADLEELAALLGLPVSEIRATASFYTMFSFEPRGRYIIRVCESPPCHVMGAGSVVAALREELAIDPGETTADGLFTLETASCLGLCGVAPAMMINDEACGNLTRQKIARVIGQLREKEGRSS